jgi:sugar O-acyltransferase (sialic acid O-acetyltransferase NeuD family)
MIRAEILVPLLNANEPEARLVGIHVKNGQAVEKGTLLFTLETTKAAADIESTEHGYVRLIANDGDTLSVGDRLAFITESPEESINSDVLEKVKNASSNQNSSELRMTKPARELAEKLGLDFSKLPSDRLVTEAVVRQITASSTPSHIPDVVFSEKHILIYGAGGHAKAVMEMVQAIGSFQIAGILDDKVSPGTQVLDIPVLGSRDVLPQLIQQGLRQAANGVGGILDINIRVKLFELMEKSGLVFPALVHLRATVEPSASVGDGVQVFANAYVGSSANLHSRCMVNTNAVVSHDCEIGSYTHIAPGALLAGHVHVGDRSLVGMGVTTAIGIKIGNGVRIGNGAIVYADVPDKSIIPAGKVWAGQF